jgi:hypothetical protein
MKPDKLKKSEKLAGAKNRHGLHPPSPKGERRGSNLSVSSKQSGISSAFDSEQTSNSQTSEDE